MKFELVHISSAQEEWSDQAIDLYREKINHFIPFTVVHLKPKKASRDSKDHKMQAEAQSFLAYLKPDDLVIILDERGKKMDSKQFAATIEKTLHSGKKRVLFIVGGAFGLSDEIQKKANLKISLSDMVMNHLVAQVVVLEQIYRAFTILKNLPYHND